MNFNGESLESDVYTFNSCNTPTSFDAPYRITSTSTTITIGWNSPADDGGCPILGYAVFRDDGAGGDIINEVNAVNDPLVRLIPTLNELTVTNFVAVTGSAIRFKVTAYNMEGSTDSQFSSIILAGPPLAPTLMPTLIDDLTDDTMISVSLPLIPDSDNGNSAIISYELLCDDGLGGDFRSIGGFSPISLVTEYTITEGIERGRTYRLIYRTLNGAGWSDYSPTLYALAATVPSAPPAPTLISSSGTSIKLGF